MIVSIIISFVLSLVSQFFFLHFSLLFVAVLRVTSWITTTLFLMLGEYFLTLILS